MCVVCVCVRVYCSHMGKVSKCEAQIPKILTYHKFQAFNTRCVVTLYVPEDMSLACRQLCLVHVYCYATFDPPPVLGLSQRGFSSHAPCQELDYVTLPFGLNLATL